MGDIILWLVGDASQISAPLGLPEAAEWAYPRVNADSKGKNARPINRRNCSKKRATVMAGESGRGKLVVRDRDVRQALHSKVLKEHHGDPDTLVLDELGLRHGICRVDIAVVNGFLHGYEIKSDADTLERLPSQVSIYSAVLDRATLVVGERHVEKAKALIPGWWGIKVAAAGARGAISFETARSVKQNPSIDPLALAELLWRPEVIAVLRELGAPEKALRQSRSGLYQHLTATIGLAELRELIRRQLKAREGWRDHRQPSLDGDSLTPIPT
jgi:hypothetical protein